MKHNQLSLAEKQSIETQKLDESSYGIINKLLAKYQPTEDLRNMHGGQESKEKIAA